jgi:hypothetical protein
VIPGRRRRTQLPDEYPTTLFIMVDQLFPYAMNRYLAPRNSILIRLGILPFETYINKPDADPLPSSA